MGAPGNDREEGDKRRRLSSESLAALVIDALVDAGLVTHEDIEKAIRVAAEEIEVRKALGDY
jgi:hypothetical protein